jgi:membrane-associated phospholipid phosphatase
MEANMSRSQRDFTGIGAGAMAAFLLVRMLYLSGATAPLDDCALRVTRRWREGPTGQLAPWVTLLGSGSRLILVAMAAALVMGRGGHWKRALLPGLVLTASYLCNLALKRSSRRVRPPGEVPLVYLIAWDRYAFPSGHAMNSAALFGLLSLWVLDSLRGPGRVAAAGVLALMPLLIGLSRVVLRVHWLSDVIAGWLGGVTVMGLVAATMHRRMEWVGKNARKDCTSR